jgi:hypothetical protein
VLFLRERTPHLPPMQSGAGKAVDVGAPESSAGERKALPHQRSRPTRDGTPEASLAAAEYGGRRGAACALYRAAAGCLHQKPFEMAKRHHEPDYCGN